MGLFFFVETARRIHARSGICRTQKAKEVARTFRVRLGKSASSFSFASSRTDIHNTVATRMNQLRKPAVFRRISRVMN